MSDGIWYAGLGQTFNFDGAGTIFAQFMSNILHQHEYRPDRCREGGSSNRYPVWRQTWGRRDPGWLVSAPALCRHFTGPPLRQEDDAAYVKKLMEFDGRRIVCGGTTGNIVARELKQK